MKKIVYNMIACCMAALLFAGCEKECDMPGGKVGGDGNSIILNLSSGALPVTPCCGCHRCGGQGKPYRCADF